MAYSTRPALSEERVQFNTAGQVELGLKTPWRDGTTNLVMSPMAFIERHIYGQLCGIEFCERYVSCGSRAGLRRPNLVAEDLPVALVRHIADSWVNRVLAGRRNW